MENMDSEGRKFILEADKRNFQSLSAFFFAVVNEKLVKVCGKLPASKSQRPFYSFRSLKSELLIFIQLGDGKGVKSFLSISRGLFIRSVKPLERERESLLFLNLILSQRKKETFLSLEKKLIDWCRGSKIYCDANSGKKWRLSAILFSRWHGRRRNLVDLKLSSKKGKSISSIQGVPGLMGNTINRLPEELETPCT